MFKYAACQADLSFFLGTSKGPAYMLLLASHDARACQFSVLSPPPACKSHASLLPLPPSSSSLLCSALSTYSSLTLFLNLSLSLCDPQCVNRTHPSSPAETARHPIPKKDKEKKKTHPKAPKPLYSVVHHMFVDKVPLFSITYVKGGFPSPGPCYYGLDRYHVYSPYSVRRLVHCTPYDPG